MKELKEQDLTEYEIKNHTISIKNSNISSIKIWNDSIKIDLYSLNLEQAKKVIKALS